MLISLNRHSQKCCFWRTNVGPFLLSISETGKPLISVCDRTGEEGKYKQSPIHLYITDPLRDLFYLTPSPCLSHSPPTLYSDDRRRSI